MHELRTVQLKEKRYKESNSPEVAKYIEISKQTLARNESLREFAKYLQDN